MPLRCGACPGPSHALTGSTRESLSLHLQLYHKPLTSLLQENIMQRLLSTTSSHAISSTRPISLTSAFTRSTLNLIRKTLETIYPEHDIHYDPSETHAAVLVPLCNVNNRPGILLEVRGKLRTHSGEVRYARKQTFIQHGSLMLGYYCVWYVASPEGALMR